MEDILALILIFGGGTLAVISFSPLGRAIGDRIRNGPAGGAGPDPVLTEEVERLRQEVAELHERVDFAERLLAQQRGSEALPPG
jgi:hypothetical protein